MKARLYSKSFNIISAILLLPSLFFMTCMDDDFDRAMKIEVLPLEVIIADRNGPVPGNEGIITNNLVTGTSIQVLWSPAIDVETEQEDLEYRLYISSNNNISTPTDAENNGEIVHDWEAGMATAIATGLFPGTTYFFNVVVRDSDSLMAAYRTVSITTLTDSVYLFNAGLHQGNLALPTTASVRNDIDGLCMQARLDDYPALPCLNVRAFISVSASDSIAGITDNFGVPTNRKITGPAGIMVAEYWADLLDGTIAMTLSDAGVASDHWWSGSTGKGTFDSDNNCGSWTTTGEKGASGKHNKADAEWIAGNIPNCDASRFVLCVCW